MGKGGGGGGSHSRCARPCRKPVALDALSCTQLVLFCFPLSYILSHHLPKMILPELSPSDAECSESGGRRVLMWPHPGGLQVHSPSSLVSLGLCDITMVCLIWKVFLFFLFCLFFSLTGIPETFPSLISILYKLFFFDCAVSHAGS